MSREYVISKVTGSVDLEFPSGSVRMGIYAGHPYDANEACVRQHPELFRPANGDVAGSSHGHAGERLVSPPEPNAEQGIE